MYVCMLVCLRYKTNICEVSVLLHSEFLNKLAGHVQLNSTLYRPGPGNIFIEFVTDCHKKKLLLPEIQ